MKKRFIFKAVVWTVLLLMITCSSGCMFSTTKANSTEQKIIGKWHGDAILRNADVDVDDSIIPFDGWIELNKDLTGSFNLGADVYTFTWSFKEMSGDSYVYYIYCTDMGELRLALYYEESKDFLCLLSGADVSHAEFSLFYRR